MGRFGVSQAVANVFTRPGCDERSIPRQTLEEGQRIEVKLNFEEEFDVVEQEQLAGGLVGECAEDAVYSNSPLFSREVEERFRRLKAPELMQDVYTGAQYANGVLVKDVSGEKPA